MNHENIIIVKKMEQQILSQALDALPEHIEITDIQYQDTDARDSGVDATVTLKIAGETRTFDADIKRIHRKATLDAFLQAQRQRETLLICNPLSAFLRQYSEEKGINYIDEAGNAHIVQPGFFLHIEGKKREKTQDTRPTLSVGIMKCLFALLADDTLLNRPYEVIAEKSGVSLGMVSKTLKYLIDIQAIPKDKKSRRFLDRSTLIQQWLAAYPQVLRKKLAPFRVKTPLHWQAMTLKEGELWGGEVAAATLTNYLEPEEYWLFTRDPIQKKMRELEARPSTDGQLLIAAPFWGKSLSVNTAAQTLLTVAELLASNDSRNREAAEILNDQYLHLHSLP
ncbi:type IV toxin-antitoxin system AbiEi family antitoxin [Enterovibrio norvegicus]|uniref:type IV toxin-antitoxin system AbiEi family antitoxin n=1 Tax=Enterovibrio norvegicus TaxID=188144 RepID=UPI001FD06D3D|nr:type IV toxin-antitoxin system AbiEi family antitoxin [Enterovibrio norvegicus]